MINEVMDVFQGEGKTQGQYRTLIRFNTCNLSCSFCDSFYSWGKGDQHIFLPKNLFPYLILSGGEPTMPKTWGYIEKNIFNVYSIKGIEIETNGTFIPNSNLGGINLWNISPKDPRYQLNKNINCDPILLSIKEKLSDYIVKFVIKEEGDLSFVNKIRERFKVPSDRIWLMPYTEKDGSSNSNLIYDLAFTNKYNFSARLHVLIKGNKRGI